MMALAKAMKASITGLRFSVQTVSFRNLRWCQELVRSTPQWIPAFSGVPLSLMTP